MFCYYIGVWDNTVVYALTALLSKGKQFLYYYLLLLLFIYLFIVNRLTGDTA